MSKVADNLYLCNIRQQLPDFFIYLSHCIVDNNIAIKINKSKICHVSARRLSIYNFAWGLLKASNLQAESKILKKLLEHQIYQSKQKISKKNCVKVDRGQKYAQTEFAGPTHNPKKNYKTIKSTNQNEIFPKKKYV
jgi:hypothetical protein